MKVEDHHMRKPSLLGASNVFTSRIWAWGAAALLAVFLSSPVARADGWSSMKGRVVISDVEFSSYGSDAEMVSAVKKQSKTAIKGDNAWTLNLMVFLKEPPGATTINIVYYDISVKPHDQVNFSEVQVQPSQKIVQVNNNAISKDLGFVKGHKYEVRATRVIGGKEKVYAKGVVQLK
jgi:hypothetical protein